MDYNTTNKKCNSSPGCIFMQVAASIVEKYEITDLSKLKHSQFQILLRKL
jgi:hypothetical protein